MSPLTNSRCEDRNEYVGRARVRCTSTAAAVSAPQLVILELQHLELQKLLLGERRPRVRRVLACGGHVVLHVGHRLACALRCHHCNEARNLLAHAMAAATPVRLSRYPLRELAAQPLDLSPHAGHLATLHASASRVPTVRLADGVAGHRRSRRRRARAQRATHRVLPHPRRRGRTEGIARPGWKASLRALSFCRIVCARSSRRGGGVRDELARRGTRRVAGRADGPARGAVRPPTRCSRIKTSI